MYFLFGDKLLLNRNVVKRCLWLCWAVGCCRLLDFAWLMTSFLELQQHISNCAQIEMYTANRNAISKFVYLFANQATRYFIHLHMVDSSDSSQALHIILIEDYYRSGTKFIDYKAHDQAHLITHISFSNFAGPASYPIICPNIIFIL